MNGFGDLRFRYTWDIVEAAEKWLLPDKIMINVQFFQPPPPTPPFGNKLLFMIDWFWNYVIHARTSRLITGDPKIHIKQIRDAVPSDATHSKDA